MAKKSQVIAFRRIDRAGDRAAAVMARLDKPVPPPRPPVFLRAVPSTSVDVDPALLARLEAAVLPGRVHWRSTADAPRTAAQRGDVVPGGVLHAARRVLA